jgi:ribosome-associated translation inhibitor RaiA
MQTPLQISVRSVEDSAAARELVRKCVEKLEVFYGRITSCRVMIEGTPTVYNVHVDIRVPEEEIVIKRQAHPELHTAIQEAFDAAGRRLQDYARRIRGDVKHSARAPR